jgi:hypothetical protein
MVLATRRKGLWILILEGLGVRKRSNACLVTEKIKDGGGEEL